MKKQAWLWTGLLVPFAATVWVQDETSTLESDQVAIEPVRAMGH